MNKKHIVYIFFVIILLIIMYNNICCKHNIKEHITDDYYNEYIESPIYTQYIQPWWNSTRYTRNMSYDVRGDIHNPVEYTGIWWLSHLL